MAVLKVARMGHPVLQKVARELTPEEIRSPEIARLLADMRETMQDYTGIGLAAPQVHQSLQMAIIELEDTEDAAPFTVFFNPKITVLDPELQGFWEGCLSIPELRGYVERPRKIQVDFLDRDAKPARIVAEGFVATVIQHELDHLAGTLFVERIRDLKKLVFTDEFERHWLPSLRADSVLAD